MTLITRDLIYLHLESDDVSVHIRTFFRVSYELFSYDQNVCCLGLRLFFFPLLVNFSEFTINVVCRCFFMIKINL